MEPNPTISEGASCKVCGGPVMPLWNYCEPCRRRLEADDRHEATEELAWRIEIEENRRRR